MSMDAFESMDAYERVVLDQIEAGLQLDGWRPKFERLERGHWYTRAPILFACLVWSVATVVTLLTIGLVSLVLGGGLAAALLAGVFVLTPAAGTAAFLTLRHRREVRRALYAR